MKEMSDSELFELVKLSNYEAFTELYQRYWKYIYSIAYKKIADKDDASDITQSVFVEFYDKREKLIIDIPVKNFLRTAALYKLSNYFRSRGFREKHYLNFQRFLAQIQDADTSFDTLTTKETTIEFEEIVELIYQAIEEMPDKMKEIFLMSRTGQYSVIEIAERLGVAPQTVKNQISSALFRIRAIAQRRGVSVSYMLFLIWLTYS